MKIPPKPLIRQAWDQWDHGTTYEHATLAQAHERACIRKRGYTVPYTPYYYINSLNLLVVVGGKGWDQRWDQGGTGGTSANSPKSHPAFLRSAGVIPARVRPFPSRSRLPRTHRDLMRHDKALANFQRRDWIDCRSSTARLSSGCGNRRLNLIHTSILYHYEQNMIHRDSAVNEIAQRRGCFCRRKGQSILPQLSAPVRPRCAA